MPFSDYRPDLMGSARLEPSGSFEAGSWQSFTLTYTAGRFGVDDSGSLKIGFRFATDFGPVQFLDPAAPGFTTVEASNGALLDCRWEFKRNIRPWSRSLYVQVVRDFLAPGDTITIRFGDRRGGSPRDSPADLLRVRVPVPRLRRSDRDLRLRGAAGEPDDPHRARPGRALAGHRADHGAGRRALPPRPEDRRQMGQSERSGRGDGAAGGRRCDRGATGNGPALTGSVRRRGDRLAVHSAGRSLHPDSG